MLGCRPRTTRSGRGNPRQRIGRPALPSGVLLFRPGNRQKRDGDRDPSVSRILMVHQDAVSDKGRWAMNRLFKQLALATLVTLITTGVASALPLQKPATHDSGAALYSRMIAPGG